MFSLVSKEILLLSSFLIVSFTSANLPIISQNGQDETINFLGRTFYKHGKPTLSAEATPPQIFRQCMDHFNGSGCNTKWDQRYWVKESYYKPGGPIFFQFGGEGAADQLIDYYYWQNYAQHYNALMIVLEHRFYGESWPSEEESFEVYQLLTSQQALADAAYFIDDFKEKRSLNGSEWVAFGCSYAGNLAAWFKQKYPNHVKTAVASSGPLLAVYDFPGYLETVSEVVKALEPQCFDQVYDAFNCMEGIVNGSTCGNYNSTSQIIPALRQCTIVDFDDLLSRETFFNILAMDKWADNWPVSKIQLNCAILSEVAGGGDSDPLSVYGNFLVRMGEGGNCTIKLKSGNAVKKGKQLSNDVWTFVNSEEGKKAGPFLWYWQTCYEFGYYMSSDPKHGLFGYNTFSGWPYGVSCRGFGERFTKEYTEERIKLTNDYYKARDIDSKCVIFVNGEWDPWHTLSINHPSETTSNNTVIFIPKSEHCMDVLDAQTEDMRIAQQKIQDQIGKYLNEPYC